MYIHYIVTPEEYDAQRYEAASTIHGRDSLEILIAEFETLTRALFTDEIIYSDQKGLLFCPTNPFDVNI